MDEMTADRDLLLNELADDFAERVSPWRAAGNH